MAINEFPTWDNQTDAEFKAHWDDAWEDATDAETPEAGDPGDHPEFATPEPGDHGDLPAYETPETADIQGQEFLAPEPHEAGDPQGSDAPGVRELEVELHGTPEPPPPQGDLGFPGPQDGYGDENPYTATPPPEVQPLDLEGFVAPFKEDIGEVEGGEGPLGQIPLNWAYPIPPQDSEEPQPQEFAGPQVEEIGDPEEYEPAEPTQYQSQDTYQADPATPPPQVEPDAFGVPQPPQVAAMNNEDLFARTGWPVAPPRVARTFWYM